MGVLVIQDTGFQCDKKFVPVSGLSGAQRENFLAIFFSASQRRPAEKA
jgi:hypothetical protein